MRSDPNQTSARPRIIPVGSIPGPEEAAAVIAAVERFIADTTPVAAPLATASGWQRAALLEGPGAKQAVIDAWSGPRGQTRFQPDRTS